MANDIRAKQEEIYQLVTEGRPMEAIDKYYAEDVVMVEVDGTEYAGKQENIEREKEFFGGVQEMRKFDVVDFVVSGEKVIDIWEMDVTHKDKGEMKGKQASISTWKDGQVVRVEFYIQSE